MSEIVVNEVSKSIYGVPIINSISMKLVSGNIYGFQGINGSGKTMLMRLICGLIYPTKGEIIIDGKRLGKEITFPQSVGLLLENPAFLDSYTGYENLEMLASIKNIITREEIHEAITSVGLDPLDKRKYKKFSLGMKQRLGIAAAIMEKPDIQGRNPLVSAHKCEQRRRGCRTYPDRHLHLNGGGCKGISLQLLN